MIFDSFSGIVCHTSFKIFEKYTFCIALLYLCSDSRQKGTERSYERTFGRPRFSSTCLTSQENNLNLPCDLLIYLDAYHQQEKYNQNISLVTKYQILVINK